ncbi:DeoR/GlpR family DNA-binding transcription regulator [uncultured Proteiniphilum sp.]|uniref:DeoR/GlpR family DNA-binding transcription regulator n=1 Tax=uncultured Proteiniphilum sp. TaxID=497637 RepID=UPI00261F0973|nr:DeoR/GlpR family DNA-binding transcription regulator [uncultured Proteiniphilum sp.]
MLSIAERHKRIMETLNKDGFVTVENLSRLLDVTSVTIRKDLSYLEKKGLLYRTHGSASPISPHISERNVVEKEKLNIDEKKRIGIAAAKLIEENDSIILNSGSTICEFAKNITPQSSLTVVTSSVTATQILSETEKVNLFLLGGNFRKRSMSVIGNSSISFLSNITCSKCFLGVDGIDAEFGITTSNIEEAELNKKMMDVSIRTIILCDSSKFRKKGFVKICDIDKVDIIVTDSGISDSMKNLLKERGIELIIA